jgi:hypothetical protein
MGGSGNCEWQKSFPHFAAREDAAIVAGGKTMHASSAADGLAMGRSNCMTDDALDQTIASLRRPGMLPAGIEPESLPATCGVASGIVTQRAGYPGASCA